MIAVRISSALLPICLCCSGAAPALRADEPGEPPLRLEQVIEGALRHRDAIVAAEKRPEAAGQYNAGQLSLVSHVKQAYHRLRRAYLMQDLIESHRVAFRDLLSVAQGKYAVGKGRQQDILKVQVQISLLDLRLVEIASDLRRRAIEVNALLGRSPESPLGRPPDVKPFVIGVSLDELRRRAAGAAPPPHPDGDGESSADALDLYDDGAQSRPYRIGDEYARAESAAKAIAVLNTTILTEARMSAHSSLVAYENGTVGLLEVLAGYVIVLEAEMSYQDELERLFVASARLEELTGVDLGR
ncbi:MAG TPA: hypothetical protein VN893_24110 [Bryobacteraceae bacterium]|nr:hypothetical protein [Bryobacteraceae bacterium]